MKNTIMSIRKAASLIREAGLTSEDIYDFLYHKTAPYNKLHHQQYSF